MQASNTATINGVSENVTKDHVLSNPEKFDLDRMLYSFQFTETELETIIDSVSVRRVLITQRSLSKDFVEKYILNDKYHVDDSDLSLSHEDVVRYQPHLKEVFFGKHNDVTKNNSIPQI